MKRTAVLSTMFSGLLVVAGPTGARAEPYVILPPSYLVLDYESNVIQLEGSDFKVHQDMEAGGRIFFTRTPDPSCDPCHVGDTFDPGFRTA